MCPIISLMGAALPAEALALLRHVHLGSFFLEPEDIKSIRMGATWNSGKVTGLKYTDMGHEGPSTSGP
jgi:hypothetical protein